MKVSGREGRMGASRGEEEGKVGKRKGRGKKGNKERERGKGEDRIEAGRKRAKK